MTLPPGLSKKDFDDALSEFSEAVGRDWVFSSGNMLETYRDVYSPVWGEATEPVASAAVAPANTEEVQKVIRIANKYKIPFWVISTGKNYGYGGPAGIVPGAITLDLKRMNRILEVNEEHAYVLVEPGVSFFDLYRYIQEKDIKLWLDVPYPGWGSVIGNTIEHGMGYTSHSDRMAFQCGMEVVLPDGDLVRTGMGAIPDSKTWQMYKHSLGPDLDGLFYQTNLGVVTKMGLWLMPEPEVYLACDINAPRFEDLATLIDAMRPLRHSGIIPNNATVAPRGVFSQEGIDLSKGHPGWVNYLAFYGPGKVVDAQVEYVLDQHSRIPGITFEKRRYTSPLIPENMSITDKVQAGIPTLILIDHPIFFSPVLPFSGETVMEQIEVYDEIAKRHGRRYHPGLHHSDSTRSIIPTPGVEVRQDDPDFNRVSLAMASDWIAESAAHGWGAYRVHNALMEDARAAYGFNDHALLRLTENIKDVLDPNGIMSPGKNGVWPKEMRSEKA